MSVYNLTGIWTGVILSKKNEIGQCRAELVQKGVFLLGVLSWNTVVPPKYDNNKYIVDGNVGELVTFRTYDSFSSVDMVGTVSDQGRKLSGTWAGVESGTFEWVRDLPNLPIESVDTAETIKDMAPA